MRRSDGSLLAFAQREEVVMAFTAECPFCRVQFRNVPSERDGASIECSRCHNFFTLAPLSDVPARKPKTAFQPAPAALAAGTMPARPTSVAETASPSASTPEPPSIADLPMPPAKPAEKKFGLPPRPRRRNWLGVSAFLLGSAAVLAASVPPLDRLTLPASGLGMVLGVAALFRPAVKGRGLVWPAAGLVVSLAVALVAGFWPALLGLPPWGRAANLPVQEQLTIVPRGNRDGSAARPATESDWVDASRNALHKSDLRLVLTSAMVKPLEYKDEKGKKVSTKEQYLLIGLRLSNVGIDHTITAASWGERESAGSDREPRLRDNLGRSYRVKAFERGADLAGHVPHATIGPLKAVTDVLVFERPPAGIEFLHLELPCSAFGATDRFQILIPRQSVNW